MHPSTEISFATLTLSVPTMTFFNGFIAKTVKATVSNHGCYRGQNVASKHARKHQEHLPLVKEKTSQFSFGFICAGVSSEWL